MNVGDVVKCIYDFPAETDKDLPISVGDLIKITKVVNADWCEGISNGKKGQFPTAFTEPSQEMFDVGIAITAFEAQQEGDLPLLQGEFVVITEKVDDNWYSGYTHGGSQGIFPVNFIKKIDFSGTSSDLPDAAVTKPVIESNENAEDLNVSSESWYEVLESFSAADANELDLVKGTSVKVLSYIDDFWCQGETVDGKQGMFPKTFLNIPNENDATNTSSEKESITVQTDDSFPTSESVIEDIPVEQPLQPISKAKALYSFQGTESGDLSFNEGEEVLILEKIDNAWFKGQIGSNVGIFPSNYVQEEPIVKKKKPPGRPKPPMLKKERDENKVYSSKPVEHPLKPEIKPLTKPADQSKPFSYYFTTQSQPTVIIPSKYSKQGLPNVVVFRKNTYEPPMNESNDTALHEVSTDSVNKDIYKSHSSVTENLNDFKTSASVNSGKALNYAKDESIKLKTKGTVIGNELKSINKNIPSDNMSTYQKMKSANSNLNSVVKISNEVGIKTTKKEVLTNAAKYGAAGYIAGSKSNKPSVPVKAFLKSK